jgi:hypothetical protein
MLKLKHYFVFDNNLHIFIQSGNWIESRVLKQSNKAVLDINSFFRGKVMGALLVLVGQHSAFTAYYVYRDNTLLETVSNFWKAHKKSWLPSQSCFQFKIVIFVFHVRYIGM